MDNEGFSQTKHIAALDFDISKIFKQLEEIEQLLKSKGLSLKELIKNNFNIDDVMVQQVSAATRQLKKLSKEIAEFNTQTAGKDIKLNIDVSEALKRVEVLESKLKEVQSAANVKTTIASPAIASAAGSSAGGSFLSAIGAKTKWWAAGTAVFAGAQVAKEAVKTLTEVEFKVMEITRVMNDATLNVQSFQSELFNLAGNMGVPSMMYPRWRYVSHRRATAYRIH